MLVTQAVNALGYFIIAPQSLHPISPISLLQRKKMFQNNLTTFKKVIKFFLMIYRMIIFALWLA
jgi:hypothetical protein